MLGAFRTPFSSPDAAQHGSAFAFRVSSAILASVATAEEARDVELTLNLNVLAVFAAFALVGAILLGAF